MPALHLPRPCAILALALALGCSREEPPRAGRAAPAAPPAPLTEQQRAEFQERALRRVARATLCRPSSEGAAPVDVYLAPLLVHEGPEGSQPAPGTVVAGEDGALLVQAQPATVYFERSLALLDGLEHEQLSFLWWYPPEAPDAPPLSQGLRVTLGSDALPLAWEVLRDPGGAELLFVAEHVEQAARREHGPPLPGRTLAVERSLDEAPRVVVARAIPAGTMTLGPFVHLQGATRSVRSLLCRCMPSQFDDLAGEVLYRLVALDSLRALGLGPSRWRDDLLLDERAAREPRAPPLEQPERLGRMLRLPTAR